LTQSAGEVAKVAIIAALAPNHQLHPLLHGEDIPHPEYIKLEGIPHSGNINRAMSSDPLPRGYY
jgi:hypothetical protein